jgi:quercetin 2,3-dioxygenase
MVTKHDTPSLVEVVMTERKILELIPARPSSDGAGVKLLRVFGGGQAERFDPFLLLDEFGSNQPGDYAGGFPSHPHRGFETVTYMLEGKMEHRDHLGNVGLLNDGDVQWMSAARGIIHSEMPRQTEGRMRGFQLWVNLPAAEKMKDPAYRDIPSSDLPTYDLGAVKVKAIAGDAQLNGKAISGYIQHLTTDPLFLDLHWQKSARLNAVLPTSHNALLYVFEGELQVGSKEDPVKTQHLARLTGDGELLLQADAGTRVLLLAGKPLREPIAQYGPFVMNTMDEVEKAMQDYRKGVLTH